MDDLKKLMAEATPLPWFTFANKHCVGGTPTDGSASGVAMCSMAARTPGEVQANAALIVAAVNALPELLALREENERLKQLLANAHGELWAGQRLAAELSDWSIDAERCMERARAALNQEPKP